MGDVEVGATAELQARRIDLIADFIEALAERGLPADSTLADLIRYERHGGAS